MSESPDWVESEYLRAMQRHADDTDAQHELAIGLREYQELFKIPAPRE